MHNFLCRRISIESFFISLACIKSDFFDPHMIFKVYFFIMLRLQLSYIFFKLNFLEQNAILPIVISLLLYVVPKRIPLLQKIS